MYTCEICNYLTSTSHNLKIHYSSRRHLNMVTDNCTNIDLYCNNCKKQYKYPSGFSRHKKICNHNDTDNDNDYTKYKLRMEVLKKDYEYQIEMQKLKYDNELTKKEYEKQIEVKEVEHKQLQMNINNNTNNNQITNIVNNNTINVKISKIKYLNLNFGNVIDINTFIENYKNSYGLTIDQTRILLENYNNDGINGCISALVYYLKKSAILQYKELKGQDIEIENVILPFLLSDKSLREHFEKSTNGNWDKTTMIDNIKRIVTITNDQVYKHHNKFMDFNAAQRKRIINGILKASAYSLLSQISIPEFYKIDDSVLEGVVDEDD